MSALGELFHRARVELACPRCHNNPRGVFVGIGMDECPECHGEMRNAHTIELLGEIARLLELQLDNHETLAEAVNQHNRRARR